MEEQVGGKHVEWDYRQTTFCLLVIECYMEFLHSVSFFSFKVELIIIPMSLERMPAISDQTRPANLPFFAYYELLLFGCLCIGVNFWGPR